MRPYRHVASCRAPNHPPCQGRVSPYSPTPQQPLHCLPTLRVLVGAETLPPASLLSPIHCFRFSAPACRPPCSSAPPSYSSLLSCLATFHSVRHRSLTSHCTTPAPSLRRTAPCPAPCPAPHRAAPHHTAPQCSTRLGGPRHQPRFASLVPQAQRQLGNPRRPREERGGDPVAAREQPCVRD
jgi:hypothetical protein